MTALPEPLARHGLRAELSPRNPAWLLVDPQGNVREAGGHLADYGLDGVRPGAAAVEAAPFLQGALPLDGVELTLPFLRLRADCYVDVHLVPDDRGDWVMVLASSGEAQQRARFEQVKNELLLDLERGGELDLGRVMRALRMRRRRSNAPKINGDQPWAPATSDLLGALNVVAFEIIDAGLCRPIGGPPTETFARRFPVLSTPFVDLAGVFPYLEDFFSDAEETWNGRGRAVHRSGVWTEEDAAGKPCRMEATALRKDGRRLLLLAFVDEEHDSLQSILQAAREHGLAFEELQRTQSALEAARQGLERRVAERTEQLTDTNRQLEEEIAERRRANARLLAYQQELRSLAAQLTLTEEKERRRIAGDLHDHIGQNLAFAKIHLGMLREDVDSPEVADKLQQIRDVIEETILYTRTLTFELAPPILYGFGLDAALDSLTRRTAERFPIKAEFRADGNEKSMDDNVRSTLFNAVRELLHNVAKHARAESVSVSSELLGPDVVVTVADDGIGFALPSERDPQTMGGFGLFSIRERMEHLGGACVIESKPGAGTRIVLQAPIQQDSKR